MIIKKIKLDDLKPNPNNSRIHSDHQIELIASSIKEFGFVNPILIDSEGNIIAGHCRFEAAKILSLSSVPCITLTDLTPAQIRAYTIADNALALRSEWDIEILKLEIEELNLLKFDIDLLGFDSNFLELIFDEESEESSEESEQDPKDKSCKCPQCGFIFE